MIKYVVELLYQDFEFDSVTDAARFLKDAVTHLNGDPSSFRMKIIEKDGNEDE